VGFMERNFKMPLYQQIVDYFKLKIYTGEFLKDEKLPTEVELASNFNVSRITSKKALEELEKMKLIYRIQGSGSYVAYNNEASTLVEKSEIFV
jgi:GntR family transcriptional regulator of arabinose operon